MAELAHAGQDGSDTSRLDALRQRDGLEGCARSADADRVRLQGNGGNSFGSRWRRSGGPLRACMGVEQGELGQAGRGLMQLALHDVGSITYLYSSPPGTPKDRVQIFRKAFQATLKDAEFVAEAKKGNFELDPVAGGGLEKKVNGFFKNDPHTINAPAELFE